VAILDFRITQNRMDEVNTVYLVRSDWDDYGFRTLYQAVYLDFSRARVKLGQVKIGEYGLQAPVRGQEPRPGVRSPALPDEFDQLDVSRFFSLGQDANYYEEIAGLGARFREAYLTAINDMAYDVNIRQRARAEQVTRTSLLRTVSWRSVDDQFARLATGGAIDINFDLDLPIRDELAATVLQCKVTSKALPPQNIHVLIGANGAGKSTTLNSIATMLIDGARNWVVESRVQLQRDQLANLVSVSFSAFDTFDPKADETEGKDGLGYRYIGIKKFIGQVGSVNLPEANTTAPLDPAARTLPHWRPRTDAELTETAVDSVKECVRVEALRLRLINAVETLEGGDRNFKRYGLSRIIAAAAHDDDLGTELTPIVSGLGSGHKIAFTVVAGLVERAAERSLVLIDEPEAHLHPPLLSALIRALSALLSDRNGLAIVATHSPVVLQEVPRSCVHIVENTGDSITLRPPEMETFGENVGTLTGEVFGLDVAKTGFHYLLEQAAEDSADYAEALAKFDRHLGAEAKAILRSLVAAKQARDLGDVGF
jgi:hypothetical protein